VAVSVDDDFRLVNLALSFDRQWENEYYKNVFGTYSLELSQHNATRIKKREIAEFMEQSDTVQSIPATN
jgi:hypothetical protein